MRIIPMASSIRPSLSSLRFSPSSSSSRFGVSLSSFAPSRRLSLLHLGSGMYAHIYIYLHVLSVSCSRFFVSRSAIWNSSIAVRYCAFWSFFFGWWFGSFSRSGIDFDEMIRLCNVDSYVIFFLCFAGTM